MGTILCDCCPLVDRKAGMRAALLRRAWVAGGAETHLLQLGHCLEGFGYEVDYLATTPQPPTDALVVLGRPDAGRAFRLVDDDARAIEQASSDYELFINAASHLPIAGRAQRNWLMVLAPSAPTNHFVRRMRRAATATARRAVDVAPPVAPVAKLRRRLQLYPTVSERRSFASYDHIIGISKFVAGIIEDQIGRPCSVLYPWVTVCVERRPKQPLISTVGRFSPYGNQKRHDILIEAARKLIDIRPELRFVFVGSVSDDPSRRYLERLRSLSDGLPLDYRVDVTPGELHRVLAGSLLYWHAAGFGLDPQISPDAVEQFGISVVEAMGHGAVPCVVPGAGPGEIVRNGESGIYWHEVNELVEKSNALIGDPTALNLMAQAAIVRSADFDGATMRQTVHALLVDH